MNLTFGSPLTDDLHQQGLVVAIHNDYKLSNINHTFWLMTKDNIAYKGEGKTNIEALDQIREQYQKRSKRENTLTLISNEVERARRKFPGATDLTVALMEECGELAQATLKCDQENIIKEAIQVAAVAIRIIEEGDSTFKNRKDISLDEKYEYEKIAKVHGFEIIEISSNGEYDEHYIILNCRNWKIRLVTSKKPSYFEFSDFINYLIEQTWIPGISGSFQKFAYDIESTEKIKSKFHGKKINCNHRSDGDSSACDHCCHFSTI